MTTTACSTYSPTTPDKRDAGSKQIVDKMLIHIP
jgi:hypothetical protein